MAIIYYSMYASKRGKVPKIRTIAAFDAIEEAIGRAVETGGIVHNTTGSISFQGPSSGGSAAQMAGISILAYITNKCLDKGAHIVSSVPAPEIYALESTIMQEEFKKFGRESEWSDDKFLRFVPKISNNAPYAAGVGGYLLREKPAVNFMFGPYYYEALVIPDAGRRAGCFQVAGTTSIGYTAFFIATCEYVCIGEELYGVQALATGDPMQAGSLRGNDLNKLWITILLIIGILATSIGAAPALLRLLNI